MKADSLDIVVLPHVLEFSNTPHQVLREVERVLIAEGHVVILGFNPLSLWNLSRLFLFWKKQAPWNATFLSASRVMDWLALLGFDVIHRQGYFYRPPFQNTNFMTKMGFFEKIGHRIWPKLGAGYVLVARKRVETLTPIRERWRAKRKLLANGLESMNRNKL
jgi:SAM-dependent methyltransferase